MVLQRLQLCHQLPQNLGSRLNPTAPQDAIQSYALRDDVKRGRLAGGTPIQFHNGVLPSASKTANHILGSAQDKQALAMQRISDLLACQSPGNQFNDPTSSDVKLTLSSKDGISTTVSGHRQILVAHSRFFAMKLSDRWSKQQRPPSSSLYIIEISDCDDVEVYIETLMLMLMYCRDLRKKLMKHDVPRVLGILKVRQDYSTRIGKV